MTQEQFEDGLAYAEDNFMNDCASHLWVDKKLIKEKFNLDGKRILDFGCGMGGMTLWYATNWDCKAYGLDIDHHHIRIAQHLKLKYEVYNAVFEIRNILKTPFREDEKFDYIFLHDVAEHIPFLQLKQILRRLSDALLPDGIIFVAYPPWKSPYAAHLFQDVPIPWSQFLPKRFLFSLIEKNNRILVGDEESTLLEAFKGLNKLTYKKLIQLIEGLELQVVYRKSHCVLNKLPFLKQYNINFFPFDFLVTKEFLMLKNEE
ncbi:MAG: class I SAM-dependent methyltransferase [Chitinophagales bacterium]